MVYNIKWADGALCLGLPSDLFFESYEYSPTIAKSIDKMCNGCPIQRECLTVGVSRKETGVWGGVYLEEGRISEELNTHKTKNDWGSLWLNLTTQMK